MSNLLLDLIIAHAMEFPIAADSNDVKFAIQSIPDNAFGVFVTIRRSKMHVLKEWPHDIHGCIGWWNSDFKIASRSELYEKTRQVAHDAVWKDDRRKYFSPLDQDLNAAIEIDYMVHHWPILKENGTFEKNSVEIKFNNDEYGLIVQSDSGRATYLPGVFPRTTSWKNLTTSLKTKAKLNEEKEKDEKENVSYFAYDIVQYSKTLWHMLDQDFLRYLFLPKILDFLNKNYDDFIPYAIEHDKTIRDKNEAVRNIATIYDMYRAGTVFSDQLSRNVLEKMTKNIMEYATQYQKNPKQLRQASSFLLLAISAMNISADLIPQICQRLSSQLETLEPNFELGEALVAIYSVCQKKDDQDQKNDQYQKNDQDQKDEQDLFKTDFENVTKGDIFKLNWQAQAQAQIQTKAQAQAQKTRNVENLARAISSLVSRMNVKQTESNYLAVALEGLSSLYPFLNDDYQERIKSIIWKLFYELEHRVDKNGFITFLSGSVRLDITGHVLNGLENLFSKTR